MSSRYTEATAQADHVTTRLSMDASEVIDAFDKAEAALVTANDVLFELDRLVGFYGDKGAGQLSANIRERIGSLALATQAAAEKPVNAIRWSVDTRDRFIGKSLVGSREQSVIADSFEDCVD